MPQTTARSRRRAEKALAEGRTPGRPGPAPKYTEEERKAVLAARDRAYREKHGEELRAKRKASYDHRHAAAVTEPKKHGRPLKYRTPEELRDAERAKTERYRHRNAEKCRQITRAASKKRKADRAIAEGRTPGLVGNPKRFATEEERVVAKKAKLLRYYERKGQQGVRLMWIALRNRRRARIKEAGGDHSAADIAYLFELQKGKCVLCLKPLIKTKFHVDHHVPLVKGGTNDRSNLRLLHSKCNLSKGARDPAEHALRSGLLCW